MHHEKWGETPCAFIELDSDHQADVNSLRTWCRDLLAPYKVPSQFIFSPIPKTSTGKIKKYVLREQAKELNKNK
jgi:fatty-acyl-CoA synthase